MKNYIYLILILFSIKCNAQDCSNIENDIERLKCFDKHHSTKTEISSVIISARDKAVEQFKDPESASFRDEIIYRSNSSIPIVCGKVNGKNSYGAFVGFKRYLSYGDLNLIENVNGDNSPIFFDRYWNLICNEDKSYNFESFKESDIFEKFGKWTVFNQNGNWIAFNKSLLNNLNLLENNFLFLTCEGNSPRIGFISNQFENIQLFGTKLKYNLSNREKIKDSWDFKGVNRIMKYDSDKKIAHLINSLLDSSEFTIEVPKAGNETIQAQFKLEGIQDIIFNIKARCPRKERYWN